MIDSVEVPDTNTVLEEALSRFKTANEVDKGNRMSFKLALAFYLGNQWAEGEADARKIDNNRPSITVNLIPQYVRQVTNRVRDNFPNPRCIPQDEADEDTAEVFDGMIRYVMNMPESKTALTSANQFQVIGGVGYAWVITDYVDEESFDQEIKLRPILNPMSVYFDRSASQLDRSDAMWCFVRSAISKDEQKIRFPDAQFVSDSTLTGMGDEKESWAAENEDCMMIAHYFTIEEEDIGKIYKLEDGTIVKKLPKGKKSVEERIIKKRKVMHRIISAVEILEETEWPGKYIPIIPIIGEQLELDGKRIVKGMGQDLIDPQRMLNYCESSNIELIANAPKTPWLVDYRQIEGFEEFWQTANSKSWAYLPYNGDPMGNTPPPSRQSVEPPVQSLAQASARMEDLFHGITGIYPPSLGAQSNEVSGTAINARKLQGDIAIYNYLDNFSLSIMHLGRILIDLIPKIYDSPRVIRILHLDGRTENKTINQWHMEEGVNKIYDLSVGRYDVSVEVGPSYKSKQEERAANLTELIKSVPQVITVAGDKLVKEMYDDKDLADRMKYLLVPALQQELSQEPDPNMPTLPPAVQAQIQKSTQQLSVLSKIVHKLMDEKEAETIKAQKDIALKQMEINAKFALAKQANDTSLVVESMKHGHQAAHTVMQAELGLMSDQNSHQNQLAVQQQAQAAQAQQAQATSQMDNQQQGQ